jgi:hypothetical protein
MIASYMLQLLFHDVPDFMLLLPLLLLLLLLCRQASAQAPAGPN